MQSLNYKNFKTGSIFCVLIAVALIAGSLIMGIKEFFLLLNADLGEYADYFFNVCTNLGDGIIWIVVILIIYVIKRKELLPLIFAVIFFSTFFTRIFKNIIVPDQARPTKAITDGSFIHTVHDVKLLTVSSFPSGHTTTAFTFYLLFCLIIPKKWWLGVGLVYASLVGYSRIYLAQHFPLDVGAGIITAILSVYLSTLVQIWWIKREKKSV